jgi:hypothetical protein
MVRCMESFTYRNAPYSVLCTSVAWFPQKKPSPVFSDMVTPNPPRKPSSRGIFPFLNILDWFLME